MSYNSRWIIMVMCKSSDLNIIKQYLEDFTNMSLTDILENDLSTYHYEVV